jgi:uncharacterized protein HemX
MQPDLLSPQREEEQPESLLSQDLSSVPDTSPPEPSPVAEAVAPTAAPATQKKRLKLNIATLALALLVLVMFMAFGWVGYWAYTLNTELTTTQGQLAALQAEHAKLQTDYAALTSDNEKLNAELTQSKADLEQANTDLTTAQADLSKSKDQGEKLDAQIETAGGLAEILYVMAISDNESDILKIDRLINETNNTQLIKEWDTFTRSPSEDAFNAFFNYLMMATRNSLR